MFPSDTAIDIVFKVDIIVRVKDIIPGGFVSQFFLNQNISIYDLRYNLQEFINVTYNKTV
jgi:hypothetical protein